MTGVLMSASPKSMAIGDAPMNELKNSLPESRYRWSVSKAKYKICNVSQRCSVLSRIGGGGVDINVPRRGRVIVTITCISIVPTLEKSSLGRKKIDISGYLSRQITTFDAKLLLEARFDWSRLASVDLGCEE